MLDKYDVDVIVWGKDTTLAELLDQSDQWQRVHRDATDAVWVRATRLAHVQGNPCRSGARGAGTALKSWSPSTVKNVRSSVDSITASMRS